MHHAVQNIGGLALQLVVDLLGDLVAVLQAQRTVHQYLQVNIAAAAEAAGLQVVDPAHAGDRKGDAAQRLLVLGAASGVGQTVHAVLHYIKGAFHDEHGYHDAGDRVGDWVAHARKAHADKAADRGQCVGPVVPRVGDQALRALLTPDFDGDVVHGLLHGDGYRGGDQRRDSGDHKAFVAAAGKGGDAVIAQAQAGVHKPDGKEERREAFVLAVTVAVLLVRWLAGDVQADDDHKGAEHVRGRVDRVRHQCRRVPVDAGEELSARQQDVRGHAEPRDEY